MEIFSLIPIIIITFFPVLIWGYIFSYLDNSPLGARRFGLGIIAGALSVVPVLFMSNIMEFTGLTKWNIFPLLSQGDNEMYLLIALLVTIGLIAVSVFVFSLGIFTLNIGKISRTFWRNTFIALSIGIFFVIFHLLFKGLNIFESALSNG